MRQPSGIPSTLYQYVSIHAPGRGATSRGATTNASKLFQFTHPGGVRLLEKKYRAECQWVSIHAPGRGATSSLSQGVAGSAVSIHAPGRGATRAVAATKPASPSFQFTHPGGVRRPFDFASAPRGWFQFTHPGGVRHFHNLRRDCRASFQFTHPGGVRLTGDFDSLWGELVSIHAPGRGATQPVRVHLE